MVVREEAENTRRGAMEADGLGLLKIEARLETTAVTVRVARWRCLVVVDKNRLDIMNDSSRYKSWLLF
jgi:hypothetical protein